MSKISHGKDKTVVFSYTLPCLFLENHINFPIIDKNGTISFYSLSLLPLDTALLDAGTPNYKLHYPTLAIVHHTLASLECKISKIPVSW